MHQEQEIHLTIRFGKTKANLGLQLFYCVQGHHQGDNRRGEVLKVDRDWRHIKVTFNLRYTWHYNPQYVILSNKVLEIED